MNRKDEVVDMRFLQLTLISLIASIGLAASMYGIYQWTGNEAYRLLYNADYIPILRQFEHLKYFGFTFHIVFCFISVIGVFLRASIFRTTIRGTSLCNRLYGWFIRALFSIVFHRRSASC